MKSIRNTFALSAVVLSIVLFWLMPNVNRAKDTDYARRYEDVDRPSTVTVADTTHSDPRHQKPREEIVVRVPRKTVYKTERIRSRDKLSKITPAKFSRAMQFEEIVLADSLAPADTVAVLP